MSLGLAAVATAAAVAAAGLAPAATTAQPPTSATCDWRESAVSLYRSLPAGSDTSADQVRAELIAAGVDKPDFLAGCGGTSSSSTTGQPAGGTTPGAPTCPSGVRPYFQAADWLWDPIPAGAKLDPASAQMAAGLADGQHVLDTGEFGVTLINADQITASTPRAAVSVSENWGPNPLAGLSVPVPAQVKIPSGSDAQVAIADPQSNKVINLWGAHRSGSGLDASWGAATPLDGDGREHNGSSTGAGIARYAAVVRASEIAAGDIPHALFFSTNMVKPSEVRYPATKTDGSNMDGAGSPIPEGARVQLDPSVDVDAIPGISKGAAAIAKALQTYGAYVGDNGGARMAFIAEYAPDSNAYEQAGLSGDYVPLDAIPWDKLRVLSDWSGGTRPAPDGADSTSGQDDQNAESAQGSDDGQDAADTATSHSNTGGDDPSVTTRSVRTTTSSQPPAASRCAPATSTAPGGDGTSPLTPPTTHPTTPPPTSTQDPSSLPLLSDPGTDAKEH